MTDAVLIVHEPVPVPMAVAAQPFVLPATPSPQATMLVAGGLPTPVQLSVERSAGTLLVAGGSQGPRGAPGPGVPELYAQDDFPSPDPSASLALLLRTGQYPGQPLLVDLYLGVRVP